MEWIDAQAKRTMRAFLLVASPETVFDELRKYGEHASADQVLGDEELEKSLLSRSEPLIDLGLASFAAEDGVVAELWNRTLGTQYSDPLFRNGIRLACLSNEAVASHSFGRFPANVFGGPDQLNRFLIDGDLAEIYVLLQNGGISAALLENLYRRNDVFASFADERWLRLISWSASNSRINDRRDTEYGPDMSHRGIHQAIFDLLEQAPITERVMDALRNLLERLDKEQVIDPDPVRLLRVLARWAKVPPGDEGNRPLESHWTKLAPQEEFRALIASLYGKTWDGKQIGIFGDPDSNDVAERSGYYANGELTARKIRKYSDREGAVFCTAILHNTNSLLNPKLRAIIEDVSYQGRFAADWSRRYEHIRKRWKWFDPRPTAEWMRSDEDIAADRIVTRQVEQFIQVAKKDMGRILRRHWWEPPVWFVLGAGLLRWISTL